MGEPQEPVTDLPCQTRPWCLFHCGTTSFAIGLEVVAEVVEADRLVRLPHSPPQVLGLCTLRREVIPVIGLAPIQPGVESAGPPSRVVVLILKTGRGPWGFRVNADGTSVAEASLEDPSPHAGQATVPGLVVAGSIRKGEAVYSVIDADATWQLVRERVEDWYRNQWGVTPTARPSSPVGALMTALEARS
jgi:chemotaxis signal transduction protein